MPYRVPPCTPTPPPKSMSPKSTPSIPSKFRCDSENPDKSKLPVGVFIDGVRTDLAGVNCCRK